MLGLRRLRYFLTVADERNFTRAAARLHVAQPALSRQLRLLEEDLGVELMRRTTHSFELTDAGAYLVEHGRPLLDQAEALDRTLREFSAGRLGRVVVAYGTSASYDTAPRLFSAVGAAMPDVQLVTRVLSAGEIVEGVAGGTIDIGVVRCPPDVDGVASQLLRLERQGVLVPRAHRLAQRPEAGLDDLQGERVLLHPREANPGHYDAVMAMLQEAGIQADVVLRDVSVDLQHTPVLDGRAVAIVGESTRLSLPTQLTWVPLTGPTSLEIRLLTRALNRSPATERFLAAAASAAAELGWRA